MEHSRPPDPDGPGDSAEIVGAVVLILVLAVGLFLEQSNLDPWIKLLGSLVDAAIAVLGVRRLRRHAERLFRTAVKRVRRWRERWGNRPPSPIDPLPWRRILAGTVIVALVATVLAVQSDHPGVAVAAGCPEPHEVRVLTSTDSLEWARELFDAYARSTVANPNPRVGHADDRCPTVHILVYSASTKAAMSALANSWTANDAQDPVRDIGPRPDLWLPDSTGDVATMLTLAQKSGYALPVPMQGAITDGRISVTPDSVISIGSSPIVIAGRTPPSGPPLSERSWSQALTEAFGAGTGLVTSDPGGSTTGLFAMVSYLLDGHGLTGPAQARQRVQVVTGAKAVPGEDSVTTLCRAGHDASAGAVITSDQLWRLYTADGGLGELCPGGLPDFAGWSAAKPGDGVPVLDYPLVQPTWTWSSPQQRTAAENLRTWLRGAAGLDALAKLDLGGPKDCLSTAPAFVATPCLAADPLAARQLYDSAKSAGRVLMVMDSSGSMNDPAATGGSRFAVASAAFAEALGQIGAEDEVGLWTFPDRSGPHRTLLDLGVGTAARRDSAVKALTTVKPSGNTPLYRTILDGLQAVSATGTADQTRALVVLTDGQDTSSGRTLQQTRDTIDSLSAATGVRLFIVAIGEAACEGAEGLSALTDGHGSCLDADLDEIAGTMAQLFESLWKGQ